MANLAAIRAQIKARLQAVPSIGVVHDYERFATTKEAMVDLYETTIGTVKQIRGWWFDRRTTAERDIDLGHVRRLHQWQIVGYLALADASATGKTLQDLVEAIADEFRDQRTLGGTVIDTRDMSLDDAPAGIQVDSIEPVMFAGVLCHRATLRLITETLESV